MARHGLAWRAVAWQARHGMAWQGRARRGRARHRTNHIAIWGERERTERRMPARSATPGRIDLPPMDLRHVILHIVGESPLIVHAWSAKAKQEMLDKQMKRATPKKEAKDPEADYEACFYRLPDGRYGFPTVAFKSAAVDAATQVSGLTKVFLRGAFHTVGELVPIIGEPRMREDMVKIGMGVADIRYRPEFPEWSADLEVRFNTNNLSLEQLVHLFNQAGFSCGVGEWRPQKDGSYGMFRVEQVHELGRGG